MKKFVISSFLLASLFLSSFQIGSAQWMPVNTGLSALLAPSIVSNAETLYVSTSGGGVYKSTDFGDNWTSISATLPTLQVNAIELAPYVIAGTDSGVYVRVNGNDWGHLSTTGMTNTNVRFMTLLPDSPGVSLTVGTPGGIFRQLHEADWESVNNGLTGAALDVRSVTLYESSTLDYGITGTADGVYMTFDNFTSWQRKSNGLTGSSMFINKVLNFGSSAAVAATDSGLFVSTDLGESWITILPSDKFTTGGGANYPGTGLGIYFFGVKGFVTTTFSTWLEIDMTGITGGLVLDFATTQNYIYVTTQSGGVFRKALSNLTGVADVTPDVPEVFHLSQNYPNPFNPATTISYSVPKESYVSLVIYDLLGREVATLARGKQAPGEYSVTWNADGMPSGVYFYRLMAGEFAEARKIVLMR